MNLLKNKVAVITGSGRGLGKGIAKVMSQKGAALVISDISEDMARACAEEIIEAGGKACFCVADVTNPDDAQKLVDTAVAKFGDFHILVNNAGIIKDGMCHKMTKENWDFVINVDLTGVFNCTKLALLYMRGKGYGRIINISSVSWRGNIGQANYAAAKAGVIGFTKTIALENAGKGITCNAICPGFMKTDMTDSMPEKIKQMVLEKIPLGHMGTPEDVGYAAAFLASDEAAYITSEVLYVHGGLGS